MLQYITTLIDKYIYKPSPKQIHDKFLVTSYGLLDKRTNVPSYSNNMGFMIFRNLNNGTADSLKILLPKAIRLD